MACGRPDDGAPVFPVDLRPPWERVRAAAGLTSHAVAGLLGHVDPGLVIRLYGHTLPSERSTAGKRMESFLEAAHR